jgi:enoyl-CoA hydratase/carnithine racemase
MYGAVCMVVQEEEDCEDSPPVLILLLFMKLLRLRREVETMQYKYLKFSIEDKVATITLNRPNKLNAWNDEMDAGLSRILLECDKNDDVMVIVLTGAGRAFCAGADLEGGEDTFSGQDKTGNGIMKSARTVYPYMLKKPVIAAINGHAVGVGITYPMTCDIRIVAEDAKIVFPFVRLGLIPEFASHVTIARVVGLSNAADLLLSGRTILGREAAELGLASKALPAGEVLLAALKMARDIATNAAPVSLAITKRLLWEGLTMSVADMMRREAPLFAWAGNQCDAKEGINSFLENRDPDWKLSVRKDFPNDLIEQEGD